MTAAAEIALLILDVDGVLTDGRLWFGRDGEALKAFHVRDGHGIKSLAAAGVGVAVISGRDSAAVSARMRELGVEDVAQGVADKARALAAEAQIDGALVDGNLAGRPVDAIACLLRDRGVPFAFVTGYGRSALPAGFEYAPIVEKPFTQEQVIRALDRLLTNVVSLRKGRRGA